MAPTATEEPPTATPLPAAFQALDETFARVEIDNIVPSHTNPRTHFDPVYIAQLAVSIAEKGIIQPLVVRPFGAKKPGIYELVAGECRYRASHKAKLTHLPCIIRELTNDQVLEIQLIENIHRHDLTPLEQAAGYRALIKSNPDKHSAATIAQRIGKSKSWVWDLMKLLDLIPKAKQLLEADLITVGHAILIARLKPEDQKRVITVDVNGFGQSRSGLWQHHGGALEFEDEASERAHKPGKYDDVKAVSVRELDDWIRDHIRFDVEHAAKAQPMVFEETAAKVEQAAATPGRGKKVISITHEYRVSDDARDEAERTYGSQSWERADGKLKSKTCEHAVLGLVVAGRGQGETFQVCVARDKCTVHFGDVIRQKEKNAKLREKGETKKADKNESAAAARERAKRDAAERARAVWEQLQPLIVADVLEQVKKIRTLTSKQAAVIEEADVYNNLRHLLHEQLGKAWFEKPVTAWLMIAAAGRDNYDSFDEYIAEVAKPLGLDVKRLTVLRDKHTPKAEPVATSGVKAAKR